MEYSGTMTEVRRVSSSQLVMGVVYGMNNSFGKIIASGFEMTPETGVLTPVVKILTNSFIGVNLHIDGWQDFKSDYDKISHYFGGPRFDAERMLGSRIVHGSHCTVFTSCFQQSAVCFSHSQTPAIGEVPTKLRQCNIILQGSTFKKLKEVSKCIDAHIQKLQRESVAVNMCARIIISALRELLSSSSEQQDVMGFLESDESIGKIKEETRRKMGESHPDFVQNSMDAVIAEIITLFQFEICALATTPEGNSY